MNKQRPKFYKPNVLELLNTKAVPIVSMKDHNPDMGNVPDEIQQMKNDEKEVALLKFQLANTPETVNSFLLNKYTDGTAFATAEKNKYDNSDERKKAGISFTYHVFYPIDPNEKLEFPNNKYVITNKLFDTETGDEYFYHFPVRKCIFKQTPYYKLDHFDELINPDGSTTAPDGYPGNGNRIFNALQILSKQLGVGVAQLPRDVWKCLVENEFMSTNGKLNLAVRTGVLVEKYFLKFDSAEKRVYGLQYLDKEFKTNPQKLVDAPDGLVTQGATGDVRTEAEEQVVETTASGVVVEEAPTTTTTANPVEDDDENIPDLDDVVVQEPNWFSVQTSTGKSKRKGNKYPEVDDSLQEVVRKLRARGVTVTMLQGTRPTKATLDDKQFPIPLCYGTSHVLLVYVRPMILGLTGLQYRGEARDLHKAWVKTITNTTMKSKIPTGKIADVIKRDFGGKLLTDPGSVTESELVAVPDYQIVKL